MNVERLLLEFATRAETLTHEHPVTVMPPEPGDPEWYVRADNVIGHGPSLEAALIDAISKL